MRSRAYGNGCRPGNKLPSSVWIAACLLIGSIVFVLPARAKDVSEKTTPKTAKSANAETVASKTGTTTTTTTKVVESSDAPAKPEPAPAKAKSAKGGSIKALGGSSTSDEDIIAYINAQIRQGWTDANIAASPPATDGEWCRRLYLDILGRVPSVDELHKFTADHSGDRRKALVDRLLSDDYVEEYAKNWTTIWTNILIGRAKDKANVRRDMVNREGMQNWLRRSFVKNKPYDQFVFDLVSAKGVNRPGEEGYNGAVNFMLDNLADNATTATAKTARYFLGLQVQCTQCHNHPFNDWKQDQFWSMNAFFRQTASDVTRKGRDIYSVKLMDKDFAGEGGDIKEAEVYYELRNGILQVAYPRFVDGTVINRSGYVKEVDRREELAKLMTKSEYLGKAIVNRTWGHFLGYGFTKPVDDIGPHNPPSHPELLTGLGKIFGETGYDYKRLIRWVVLSEPYSLSSKAVARNKKDDPSLGEKPLFSHFYLRQMQAEDLYESLIVATQADRASKASYEEQEKVKSDWLQQFTIAFGTDEGDEATTFNGTIPQTLMMMNGDLIEKATSIESGSFLQRIATGNLKNPAKINYLYEAALARVPSKTELEVANNLMVARKGNAAAALQDVWWAILNSNEFIINH